MKYDCKNISRMTKHNYIVGDKQFKSKKTCQEYVRDRISKIGIGTFADGCEEFQFLHDVLNNHSERDIKVGCGVKRFVISRNTIQPKSYETSLLRVDGTSVVFSWRHCCEFKARAHRQNLLTAMRQAVSQFTVDFKQKHCRPLRCHKCHNSQLDYSQYHTDHIIPFSKIAEDFLSNDTTVPFEFADCHGFGSCFKREDADFQQRWINYHNKHAKYQILCFRCNCSKGSKITPTIDAYLRNI